VKFAVKITKTTTTEQFIEAKNEEEAIKEGLEFFRKYEHEHHSEIKIQTKISCSDEEANHIFGTDTFKIEYDNTKHLIEFDGEIQ
jgi:hypothetical protein